MGGTSGTLIGRSAEFAALSSALDTAADGRATVVVVSGDAGVGKTRLVGELSAAARAHGVTVLVGQCAELGETMPYLPLVDALWTAVRDPRTAELVRSALASRPVLRRLLPDGENGDGGRDRAVSPDRQQLFGVALGLLGELAGQAPVLLVLEDLHWADQSTRDLLTFLSRMLQSERVCVVGTYRSDDLHRRHPLRPVIAELLRLPGVGQVTVRPFGEAETAEYLAMLGGVGTSPEIVQRVHARSEGNPFYAGELYSAAAGGAELPAGLADLLLARVERLGEEAQRVVRVAAVAGRRIDDELVRQVSGLAEPVAEKALRELVSHQILVPAGPDGYAFRHALLREAVYGDLLPGETTRLHAAFAELLSRDPAGDRSAAELAYHSLAAHDLPAAFEASVRAGLRAERIGAPAEAHDHFDQALSLWDRVPDAAALAGMDRFRVALAAVRSSGNSGRPRKALTRLRQMLDLAPPDEMLLVAEVRERIAYYLMDLDRVEEARREIQAAVETLPAQPPTVQRARLLAGYARALTFGDRHREVRALAEEAIAAARATGARDAEASALVTLGIFHEHRDTSPEEIDYLTRAIALGRDLGDTQVVQRAAYQYARATYERGDLAGAAAAVDESVAYAMEQGLAWSSHGANLRCLQFLVHYTAGDWVRARELAAGFVVRVGRLFEAQVSAYALFLGVATGSPDVAERMLWLRAFWKPGVENAFIVYVTRGLLAESALWSGDPAQGLDHALAALDACPPLSSRVIRIAGTALWALADQAAAARAAGDAAAERAALDRAGQIADRARRAASTTADGSTRAWLGVEGVGWLARVEAESRRAHGTDSPADWRAVVDAFDHGFVYELARSRWRLAESLAAGGDRAAAAEQWSLAEATARELGAAPLLAALTDLGDRARLHAPRPGPPAGGPLGALTAREREVLGLVADGMGNREIAAALFISPKTASVHVSNILAKLGVATRTQAAALAHREGGTGR